MGSLFSVNPMYSVNLVSVKVMLHCILKTQKELAWGKGNGQRLCPCGEKIAGAYGAVILGGGS